jgi:hypothetical protein
VNNPITITATLPAWVTSGRSVSRVLDYVKDGKQQTAAEAMFFTSSEMDKGSEPWTRVGEADLSIRLFSRDDLVTSQLHTLKKQLDHARAEWLTKQQALLEQISKLQALTNEVEEA